MTRHEKHDEVFWDNLLEEIDLEGTDLAAAEARMSAAEDVPLAPGQAERMVRHATHGVPVLKLRERKGNPFQRWLRAAVILMGSSTTLTVGTVAAATVAVAYLVWSVGQRSRETMTDEMALELLWQPDQPEQDRMSAMLKVAMRAEEGVVALRALRDDAATPQPIVNAATLGVARLAELIQIQPPQRLTGRFQDIGPATLLLADATLPIESRALHVERLIVSIGTAVGELRCMPAQTADIAQSRDKKLNWLRYQLTR